MKPCNCASLNKERSSYDNIKRLAEKMSKSEKKMYVIIKKDDNTFTFEPFCAMESSGVIVEYIHYL